MKLKKILIGVIALFSIISCYEKEHLIATNSGDREELTFPEGTAFDNTTEAIYEKFGVRIFWGEQISSNYVNRAWIGLSGKRFFNYLTEEQARKTIELLNDYVFSKIDAKLFNKALKPNIYLVYDLCTVMGTGYAPEMIYRDPIDNWTFSFFGEGIKKYPMYPTQLHELPKTEDAKLKIRYILFSNMFNSLIEQGIIEIPTQFRTDFDYSKRNLKSKPGEANDPLFYMNQKFCGELNLTSSNIMKLSSTNTFSLTKNFLTYIILVSKYSREDIDNGAGVEGVPFKNYPEILKYYDLTEKYMIEKYGYDLKQLQKK